MKQLGWLVVIGMLLAIGSSPVDAEDQPAWHCTRNKEFADVTYCSRSLSECASFWLDSHGDYETCASLERAACFSSRRILENHVEESCYPMITLCEKMQARARQDHDLDDVTECQAQRPDDAANAAADHARHVRYAAFAAKIAPVLLGGLATWLFVRWRNRRTAAG